MLERRCCCCLKGAMEDAAAPGVRVKKFFRMVGSLGVSGVGSGDSVGAVTDNRLFQVSENVRFRFEVCSAVARGLNSWWAKLRSGFGSRERSPTGEVFCRETRGDDFLLWRRLSTEGTEETYLLSLRADGPLDLLLEFAPSTEE